jgi:hypothetical protein
MSGKERKIDRSRDKKRVKTQLKQFGKRYYSEDDNTLPEGAFSQDYNYNNNNNRLEENSEKMIQNNDNVNDIQTEDKIVKDGENDFVEDEFTDDYFEPKVMK